MNKNLSEYVKEQEISIKNILAKKKQGQAILKVYPDAFLSEIENGNKSYISKSVKYDTPQAKPEFIYGGNLGTSPGRFHVRWVVPVGKEKVYSFLTATIQNLEVNNLLNQYIKMPSGKVSVLEILPSEMMRTEISTRSIVKN